MFGCMRYDSEQKLEEHDTDSNTTSGFEKFQLFSGAELGELPSLTVCKLALMNQLLTPSKHYLSSQYKKRFNEAT